MQPRMGKGTTLPKSLRRGLESCCGNSANDPPGCEGQQPPEARLAEGHPATWSLDCPRGLKSRNGFGVRKAKPTDVTVTRTLSSSRVCFLIHVFFLLFLQKLFVSNSLVHMIRKKRKRQNKQQRKPQVRRPASLGCCHCSQP